MLTVLFRVFAINVYKIGLPFTQTLAHDQCRDLLIAFPKLDHQSVFFFFSDSAAFDKVSYGRHAQRTLSYDREHFSNS